MLGPRKAAIVQGMPWMEVIGQKFVEVSSSPALAVVTRFSAEQMWIAPPSWRTFLGFHWLDCCAVGKSDASIQALQMVKKKAPHAGVYIITPPFTWWCLILHHHLHLCSVKFKAFCSLYFCDLVLKLCMSLNLANAWQ